MNDETKALQTKIFEVTGVHGSALVRAKTKAGAIRAYTDFVHRNAGAEVASQEAIYAAGKSDVSIIDEVAA